MRAELLALGKRVYFDTVDEDEYPFKPEYAERIADDILDAMWAEWLGASLAGAAYVAKADEYKFEARRLRKMATAVLEASGDGEQGAICEIYSVPVIQSNDPGVGILICSPNLNERNFGPAAAEILREWFIGLNLPPNTLEVKTDPNSMHIMGTEADPKEKP